MSNIQMREAEMLRKVWGDKPCSHPVLHREYDLGSHTGDFICGQCGKCFSPNEVDQLEKERKVKEKSENRQNS